MDGKSKSALLSVGIPIEKYINKFLKKGWVTQKIPPPRTKKHELTKTQQTKPYIVNSYANIVIYILITK
jgi:hypothetical protein